MSTLQNYITSLSPVGYWPLDELTGTTAYDRSGNARHGTYNGSPALASRNLLNMRACNFDGTDDFVSIPSTGLNTGGNAFSQFFMILVDSLPSGGALVSTAYPSTVAYTVNWDDGSPGSGSGTTRFTISRYSGGWQAAAGTTLTTGVVHTITITSSGTAILLYQDGLLTATLNSTAGASSGTHYLMRRWDTSGTNNYTDGAMCQVGYWNTQLAATTVANLHATAMRGGVSY